MSETAYIIGQREEIIEMMNVILANTGSELRITAEQSVEQINDAVAKKFADENGRLHTLSMFFGKEERAEDVCPKHTLRDGKVHTITLDDVKYVEGFRVRELTELDNNRMGVSFSVDPLDVITIGLLFPNTPTWDDVMERFPQFDFLISNWWYGGSIDWWCHCYMRENGETIYKKIKMDDEEGKTELLRRYPQIFEPDFKELAEAIAEQEGNEDSFPFQELDEETYQEWLETKCSEEDNHPAC